MEMQDEDTNLTDFIIAFLLSGKSTRRMYRIMWEQVQKRRNANQAVLRQSLKRMEGAGIIHREGETISLVGDGHSDIIRYRVIAVTVDKSHQLLIIFDIPEHQRKARDWLRDQIKFWNFKMIQKSVWLRTGPLPAIFYKRAKSLAIDKHIQTFKLQKTKTTP